MQKDSGNSKNEKKDLCGQSPLVDTEILTKVKKTADFIWNQPFLLDNQGIMDTLLGGGQGAVTAL